VRSQRGANTLDVGLPYEDLDGSVQVFFGQRTQAHQLIGRRLRQCRDDEQQLSVFDQVGPQSIKPCLAEPGKHAFDCHLAPDERADV
jgi:hypothetical protein